MGNLPVKIRVESSNAITDRLTASTQPKEGVRRVSEEEMPILIIRQTLNAVGIGVTYDFLQDRD
jgi:hypothetical protein